MPKASFRFMLLLLMLPACVATGPKFTRVEKVMKLRTGITQKQVDSVLNIKPYDVVSLEPNGNRTVLYKYRVTDRRTLPFLLRDTNGYTYRGKFADLLITYSTTDTVLSLVTRPTDSEIKTRKLDINAILTLVTVTVPSVMVYLGLKTTG